MNDNDQQTQPTGRSISVTAFGDNAEEVELDALDKARTFFGDDVQLRVERNYEVSSTRLDPPERQAKSHRAIVKVFVVE